MKWGGGDARRVIPGNRLWKKSHSPERQTLKVQEVHSALLAFWNVPLPPPSLPGSQSGCDFKGRRDGGVGVETRFR